MSFVLSSTEEDPIELHLTENAPIQLGRTFLNIFDTKVSRLQVEISINDGKVVVKQLGVNPSVIKKADGKAWLLKRNETATLDPNDHLLLIATATTDKHTEFKLTKKGVKRRIQEEDEAEVIDEVPKKRMKVEEDVNMTVDETEKSVDLTKESKNQKSDNESMFDKEIKELRSILPEVSLEDIQTALLLAEGSVELALQSLLDNKTKSSNNDNNSNNNKSNGSTDNKNNGTSNGSGRSKLGKVSDGGEIVDEEHVATPPTSPIHENEEEAPRPAIGRTDSDLAMELQRQWENEIRNAPQEYDNNEVKSAQKAINEQVEKLKLVADNCGAFYDETSFPAAFGVRMALDMTTLEKWKAKQLGINPEKPIIIQLKFTAEFTDYKDPPNFLIFQSGDKELSALSLKDYETDFGAMQWFLETRLTKVLLKNWANKPVQSVKDEKKSGEVKNEKKQDQKVEEKKSASSAAKLGVDETKLKQLTAMGFAEAKSIEALIECKGNLDSATEMLLTGKAPATEPADKDEVKQLLNMGFKRTEAINALKAFDNDVKKAVASLLGEDVPDSQEEIIPTYVVGRGKGKKVAKRPKYGGMYRTADDQFPENKPIDEEEEEEDDPIDALEYKIDQERLFTEDAPFLVRLYQYMLFKFTTSPKYCMICDKNLDLDTSYKLPVCKRKACVNVYNTSACGGNIINEIKNQPEVVELLLHLLSCAATGNNARGYNRNGVGLSPKAGRGGYAAYPGMGGRGYGAPAKNFEPFPHNLGFNYDDGSQNIDLLISTLNSIPAIKVMQECASDEQLKVILDDLDPLIFPLLKWVIRSNRAHVSYVPPEKQIASMKTPYQFQLVNSFPEHEKKFLEWKEQAAISKAKQGLDDVNGSYWSFHGSPVENWHSIIRTGLRSGFVKGIYHAQQAIVSLGYMQVGVGKAHGWKNGSWKPTEQISCISLIEVADFREAKGGKAKITGGTGKGVPGGEDSVINVAMIDSLVVTRFLFFYPKGPTFQPPPAAYAAPMYGAFGGFGAPMYNPAAMGPVAHRLGVKDFMFIPDTDKKKEDEFDYAEWQ